MLSKKWFNINNFEEALAVNRDFIAGKIKKAPYHFSPIKDTPIKTLYELNNYIFTYDGQSNKCVYNMYIEPWKKVVLGNKIKGGGVYFSTKQKNYLCAIVPKKYIEEMRKYLDNTGLKYVITGNNDDEFIRYTNVSNDSCIYNLKWFYHYSIPVTVDFSSSVITDISDMKWNDFTDIPIIQNEQENIVWCNSLTKFYPNFLNDGYNLCVFNDGGNGGNSGKDIIDLLLLFFNH